MSSNPVRGAACHLSPTSAARTPRCCNDPGLARPAQWAEVIRRHGAGVDFLGLDLRRFPHDIGFLGRYGRALDRLPRVSGLWEAQPVDAALEGLAASGLGVERSCGDVAAS
jgi:hypothetical protein